MTENTNKKPASVKRRHGPGGGAQSSGRMIKLPLCCWGC